MLVVLTVFLGIVMVKIAFTDMTVPVSSTDVEAAARSNERLLQIIQWVLATVLGLGLALIGINWFQSTRDRAEIHELESELRTRIAEFDNRLVTLQSTSDTLEARLVKFELRYAIDDQGFFSFGSVAYCIQAFQKAEAGSIRKRASLEEAIRYAQKARVNTDGDHNALLSALEEIRSYDRGLAGEVSGILGRDMMEGRLLPDDKRPLYAGGTKRQ